MAGVKVYTTENCPYCRMVRAFLKKQGVEFEVVDVGKDREAAREMIRLSGQRGVPVTVFGDEVVVGFDAKRLRDAGSGRGLRCGHRGRRPGRADGRGLLCPETDEDGYTNRECRRPGVMELDDRELHGVHDDQGGKTLSISSRSRSGGSTSISSSIASRPSTGRTMASLSGPPRRTRFVAGRSSLLPGKSPGPWGSRARTG